MANISELISEAKQKAAAEGRELTSAEMLALLDTADKLSTQQDNGEVTLRVSEKGAVSVYRLGRFPVTLYREQWEKLHENMPAIMDFIKANASKLKTKAARAEAK